MFRTIVPIIAILFISCAPSQKKGEPSSAEVSGLNISGDYRLVGVECYSNATNELAYAGIIRDIFTDVTIRGNRYTETMSDVDCSQTYTGNIVFHSNGKYTMSDTNITRTWDCQLNGNLALSPVAGGRAYEQAFNFSAVNESSEDVRTDRYISDPRFGDIAWFMPAHYTFPPGTYCLSVFNRM